MKIRSTLMILMFPLSVFASGGESSGGGNFKAADFVASARALAAEISDAHAWSALGVQSNDFENAISSAHVYCASGDRLRQLIAGKLDAYYDQKTNSINLVCAQWSSRLSSNQKMTLFHEYMRVLRLEKSDYAISSRLAEAIDESRQIQKRLATYDLEKAIWDGDVPRIFDNVKKGADLNRPNDPSVYAVVSTAGVHWTEVNEVRDDSRSGLTFSRDQKVMLVSYLIEHGADPNVFVTNGTNQGKAAVHVAQDAAVMATLLDNGANPLLVARSGEQALLGFLFAYPYSDNKPYFRMVVERLINAGSDLNNCFNDGSGCVMSEVQRVGDAELLALFAKYKKTTP